MPANDAASIYAREIATTRVFDAPRELVWRAWSEPEHLRNWWGPKGFTDTIHEFDFHPGGIWRHTMHGPDGKDYNNEAVFVEIVRPERIIMDHTNWPRFRLTVTFEEIGSKTKISFRQLFESPDDYAKLRPIAMPANEENFDKLAAQVSILRTNMRELTITRTFDVPRTLAWRAWTSAEHLARWWGPKNFTNPVCEIDARTGGAIRIVMRAPDGAEYPMRGEFREVKAPERLVFSNIAVDARGNDLIDGVTTVTFTDIGGKTEMRLHTRATALTPIALGMIAGMESGWTQSIDRLDAQLAAYRRQPVVPFLIVDGAATAIDYYTRAFGAAEAERMMAEDGKRIVFAHLRLNGGSLYLNDPFTDHGGPAAPEPGQRAPCSVVLELASAAEVDAMWRRAVDAGGKGVDAPRDEVWGARFATLTDPSGHLWLLNAPRA
jgi:uncharacterized protein YndB with AHSA1/START domain/uncharacterized glyoxalase superfamily protein PhnB